MSRQHFFVSCGAEPASPEPRSWTRLASARGNCSEAGASQTSTGLALFRMLRLRRGGTETLARYEKLDAEGATESFAVKEVDLQILHMPRIARHIRHVAQQISHTRGRPASGPTKRGWCAGWPAWSLRC